MNKKILLLNILFLCLAAFTWQSCQYNPCKARAVECQNGGICDDGACTCSLGYEGDSCQTPINEKFNSHYAMVKTEYINSIPPQRVDDDDTLNVVADKVRRNILNFYSIRDSMTAFEGHVRENALTIPEQKINGITYSGEGSLNGTILTITIDKNDKVNAISSQITLVGRQYETF